MTTRSDRQLPGQTPGASDGSQIRRPFTALRFEGTSQAPAEAIYDVLADLHAHLDWAGERQAETTRLLTVEAPAGPARVGTEFVSTGSDGKVARFTDRSVVTEAQRPAVFEFVTESHRVGKPGSRPWLLTLVHHYEIKAEETGSRLVYTEEITRMAGAPKVFALPGLRSLVFRLAAKYMRRGFDALIAVAEERSGLRSPISAGGR